MLRTLALFLMERRDAGDLGVLKSRIAATASRISFQGGGRPGLFSVPTELMKAIEAVRATRRIRAQRSCQTGEDTTQRARGREKEETPRESSRLTSLRGRISFLRIDE